MKVSTTLRANVDAELARILRDMARQINGLSEGSIAARYNAAAAAPTTGTWAKGDTLTNSNPAELGTALSKYVVTGWICVASGTPGTWVQTRTLTGN